MPEPGLISSKPADVLSDCPEFDTSATRTFTRHRPVGRSHLIGARRTGPSLSCPSFRRCGVTHPKRKEQTTITTIARRITGGVDTHLDVHVAAALDERGALLGVESFPSTAAGYRKLLGWLESFGILELVGVEGTGSYGAGLTRHLLAHDVAVVEVDRPNRQRRRRTSKSDPADAVAVARAAQGGDATGSAESRDGNVEAMRVLRVARLSARRSRTQAINQMRSLISTAPEELRAELRDLSINRVLALASGYRHTGRSDVTTVTKLTLPTLARRALSLEEEVKEIDRLLKTLVAETAPELHAIDGVGSDVASALFVAAGDNPDRLKNEATFAKLAASHPSTPRAANKSGTD